MTRDDWSDREDSRRLRDRRDFGQADYSRDYAYDPAARSGYRADEVLRRAEPRPFDREAEARRGEQPRSWMDRAGEFLSGQDRAASRPRRGPSDRLLWAVIAEHLESERGLDLRQVEISVDRAEVTLNGYVRNKAEKRRIEDLVDIDGVRHVQNNLRVHERWTLF